jgi:hypothetical protein
MDLTNILIQTGALTGIIGGLGALGAKWVNRRLDRTIEKINLSQAEMNKAQATATEQTSEADYAEKIIKQSDERVKQALDDKERAVSERDAAYAEAKGQRKAKQEWREKYFEEEKAHHATQLSLKDTEAKLAEAEWHRCEVNGCSKRMPPRSRENTEI